MDKAMAVLGSAHGGQVLLEQEAFLSIASDLSTIAQSLPSTPEAYESGAKDTLQAEVKAGRQVCNQHLSYIASHGLLPRVFLSL